MAVIKDLFEESPKVVPDLFEGPKSKVVTDLFDEPTQKEGPTVGGLAKQFGIGFGNEALLGFPLFSLEKVKGEEARKALESDIPVERIARGVGTTVGLATVLPRLAFTLPVKGVRALQATQKARRSAAALRAAVGADKARTIGKFFSRAAEGGAGAAAFTALSAPRQGRDFEDKIVDVPTSALFGAGIFSIGGAVADPIRKFLDKKGILSKGYITKEAGEMFAKRATPSSGAKMGTKRTGNFIETKIVDKLSPIRYWVEEVEKSIGQSLKLKPKEDPFILARLGAGVGGKIGLRAQRLGRTIEPVRRFIKPLEELMFFQRAKERWVNAGDKLARLKAISLKGLTKAQASNVRSQIKQIEKAIEGRAINPRGVTDQIADQRIAEIRQALGEQTFSQVETAARKVRGQIRGLLRNLKNEGVISEEDFGRMVKRGEFYSPFEVVSRMEDDLARLPLGKNAFRATESSFLKETKGTALDIDNPLQSIVRYIQKASLLAERNRVSKSVLALRDKHPAFQEMIVPLGKGAQIPKGMDRVSAFVGGKKQEFAIDKNVADALKGVNKETIDMITQTASFMGRALRVGATQLNLAFAIPNMIRDFQTASFVSKVGFSPISWAEGLSIALGRRFGSKGAQRAFNRFVNSGASFSGFQQIFRRTAPQTAQELAPSLSKKAITGVNPFKWISETAQISEEATRLGVFQRGLKRGLSMPEAAFNARNATIDFARSGTLMQTLNMWVPFLNARTQGTVNMLKVFNKAGKQVKGGRFPAELALTGSALVTGPLLATYAWNTTRFPEVWESIRQFEKDQNFIVILGNEQDKDGKFTQIAKIPKGEFGKVLGNPIEAFLEFYRGDDPTDFNNTANLILTEIGPQIADDILPVDFLREGELDPTRPITSITPPFVKAPLEAAANVNFFTGRDIVPKRLQTAKPPEQFTEKTSPTAVVLGEMLNVSPLQIENFMGTMFGGLGRQVLDPIKIQQGIGRRFTGAFGEQEVQDDLDIINDIEMDIGTRKAQQNRKVRQAAIDWEKVPPLPQARRQFIAERFKGDKKALNDFVELISAKNSGENFVHRKLRRLPVKARIQFVRQKFSELPDEEKGEFLKEMFQQKILTVQGIKKFLRENK